MCVNAYLASIINGDSLSLEDIVRLIGYAGPMVEEVLFQREGS